MAEEAGTQSAEHADHVSIAVSMPQLSWRADGTVDGWFKQVGDYVHAGDLLVEVSGGRIYQAEVRAPISGFLREVIIPAQITVAVSTELGIIETVSEAEQAEMVSKRSSPTWRFTGETSSVTMPSVEGSGREGTILRWLKQAGEYIHVDEPAVEIITDMVDIEVLAPASGLLDWIAVQEDERVSVGTVLGVIKHAIKEKARPIPNVAATRPLFTLKVPKWVADTARPTILRWLKPVGSRVELHESLLEITTDYFDVAVECPVTGIVHAILAADDELVEAHTELALINITAPPQAGGHQSLLSILLPRSLLRL